MKSDKIIVVGIALFLFLYWVLWLSVAVYMIYKAVTTGHSAFCIMGAFFLICGILLGEFVVEAYKDAKKKLLG